MQSVERKPEKKRGAGLLGGLLALLLLAAGAAVLFLLRSEDKLPEVENPRGALSDRDISEIAEMELRFQSGEGWQARRDEAGVMRMMTGEEAGWPLDPLVAEPLMDALANMTYERILTENPEDYQGHLADFGLEPPRLTVMVCYTDGTESEYLLGDTADAEGHVCYLLRKGDTRLYTVSADTYRDLSVEREGLHAVPELAIYAALLDRISLRDAEGRTKAEWALEGQITDQDAGCSWRVTVPFAYPADEETLSQMKKSAENLRLGAWADVDGTTLQQTGSLIFHMAAGSTGTVSEAGVYDVTDHMESTVTLSLMGAKNEMVDYVLYEGEVYTVSHFSLSVFTEADPEKTAARYPVLTPLNSLEAMTVEEKGKAKTTYTLSREGEEMTCEKDGQAFSAEMFSAAYERLLVVTVSGRLPEKTEIGEAHTRYTFETVSGKTHTVVLSAWDALHDAVTVDGQTRYYLFRESMHFQGNDD